MKYLIILIICFCLSGCIKPLTKEKIFSRKWEQVAYGEIDKVEYAQGTFWYEPITFIHFKDNSICAMYGLYSINSSMRKNKVIIYKKKDCISDVYEIKAQNQEKV